MKPKKCILTESDIWTLMNALSITRDAVEEDMKKHPSIKTQLQEASNSFEALRLRLESSDLIEVE